MNTKDLVEEKVTIPQNSTEVFEEVHIYPAAFVKNQRRIQVGKLKRQAELVKKGIQLLLSDMSVDGFSFRGELSPELKKFLTGNGYHVNEGVDLVSISLVPYVKTTGFIFPIV